MPVIAGLIIAPARTAIVLPLRFADQLDNVCAAVAARAGPDRHLIRDVGEIARIYRTEPTRAGVVAGGLGNPDVRPEPLPATFADRPFSQSVGLEQRPVECLPVSFSIPWLRDFAASRRLTPNGSAYPSGRAYRLGAWPRGYG